MLFYPTELHVAVVLSALLNYVQLRVPLWLMVNIAATVWEPAERLLEETSHRDSDRSHAAVLQWTYALSYTLSTNAKPQFLELLAASSG